MADRRGPLVERATVGKRSTGNVPGWWWWCWWQAYVSTASVAEPSVIGNIEVGTILEKTKPTWVPRTWPGVIGASQCRLVVSIGYSGGGWGHLHLQCLRTSGRVPLHNCVPGAALWCWATLETFASRWDSRHHIPGELGTSPHSPIQEQRVCFRSMSFLQNQTCTHLEFLANSANIKFADNCLNRKVRELSSVLSAFVASSKMGICLECVPGINFKWPGRDPKWRGTWTLAVPALLSGTTWEGMKAEEEGRRQTGTATQPRSMNQDSSSASKARVVTFIAALLGTDMAHRVPVLYVNVLLAMPKVPGTQRVLHRHL